MRLFLKVLFFSSFFSLYADADPNFPSTRRITLRHIESGGVGYTTGYTTLEAFISASPNTWKTTPFFDARGHIFDNGTWAANGGIGLRSELRERIYGINLYYDYRGTKHLHYNQASVGLETLGTFLDARINGYFPFGRKTSSPYDAKFGYFSGHTLFLSEKIEFAMTGINAEVGFHLGHCDSWHFYTNAGPYYFHGAGGPNAWGGKVRASLSYQDFLKVEIVESYDNVFHNKTQGQIGFSIPLGPKTKATKTGKLYCRKLQPVERNEIVVLSDKHKNGVAINPITGSPYYFLFVNNMSSSLGTFESPYPSLALAESNSAPHQVIYVFPGDGTTTNMDLGITLQPGQKLWGSGTSQPLETKQGLITVPQMSQLAPQITNSTLLGAGATLSTDNQIRGITFTETSGQAVTGTDPGTVDLSFCTFTASAPEQLGIYPVYLEASSPLTATLNNNVFTNNSNAGVLVKLFAGASSTQITMNNTQAYDNPANSGNVGILNIEARENVGACTLVMSNNIFTNNACGACNITDFDGMHDGSFTSFQGTFTSNICSGSTQAAAITFATNADTCTLTILDNNLSNNTHGSVLVVAGAGGTQAIGQGVIVIDSNQMNGGGSSGDAITISPAGNTIDITITNNTISNNMGTGFVSYFISPGPAATLSIIDNVIVGNQNNNSNASGGISFDQFKSVSATIQNNTLSNNAQGNSIGFYGSGTHPETSSVVFISNTLSEGDTFDFEYYGDAPSTGCLTLTGNTSATSPGYTFSQNGDGACFIVPCNYATQNTGDVTLNNIVTPSASCAGAACP